MNLPHRQPVGPSSNYAWERTIPSVPEQGMPVLDEIMSQVRALGWVEPELFGVRLALEEALMNAIKHGNGSDPRKTVWIRCQLTAELIRIEIQDEGGGFIPGEVPDPTDPANLEKPSGRGIAMMCHFMSSVEYNEAGNHVVMEKRRAA